MNELEMLRHQLELEQDIAIQQQQEQEHLDTCIRNMVLNQLNSMQMLLFPLFKNPFLQISQMFHLLNPHPHNSNHFLQVADPIMNP